MEISQQVSILISGIISGIILFQTVVIAPLVFKTLDEKNSRPFLRSIFPKLFVLIALLSTVSFFQNLLFNNNFILTIVSFITFISMLACYLIIPATNKARDDGNDKVFKRLHTISVILTIFVLLANLFWFFLDT